MQIGEEKKEGNQYQDLFSPWQAAQLPTLRRNKVQSPSPPPNRNTWLFSTLSRSKSGSTVFSKKSATTSAIKTSSTATTRVPSHSHKIRNNTPAPSISTSNNTASGTAVKMPQHRCHVHQRAR